jgi:AraC family transcriptional regulator
MDAQQIRIIKDSQPAALGEHPCALPEVLPGWTGLRIVRFRVPELVTDRHVMAPHPIVSLLCEGAMASRMRAGQREMRAEVKADELMFYSGGKEIDYAHWQTRDATLISVELDPERLRMDARDDNRHPERHLRGDPCFTDAELGALVRMLWREGRDGCPHGRLFADSLCLGLAMHVYRRFGESRSERGEAGARLTQRQLQCIDDYIDAHLDQSIGLDDLAQAVGLSRFHFSRLFSNTLGRSPYQHVIRKRLARARHLLVSSELSVAAVALSAGFSSQAHFSALCRRELGVTPRSLREGRR